MSNELQNFPAQISYKAHEIPIDWDSILKDKNLNPRTVKEIQNAWKNFAIIDGVGYVWVSIDGLRSILRLSKRDSVIHRLIYNMYVKKSDKRKIEGKEYIRGTALGKMIDMNIQGSFSFSKRDYSKYAQAIYLKISHHEYAENLRAKAGELWIKSRSSLKSTRIKRLGIVYDELTGDKLQSYSHFSHIRSVSLFPELSLFYWNGLIINPDVHKEITSQNVHNEEMLFNLCYKLSWRTNWLDPYKLDLQQIGYTPLI